MNRKIEVAISVFLCLFIVPFVATIVHHKMVKESGRVKKLKRASYKELKEKMLSIEWEFNPSHPCSLFDKNNYWENYFHASIFEFNGVGYLLTPYGLIMANVLQRKIRKMIRYGKEYIE